MNSWPWQIQPVHLHTYHLGVHQWKENWVDLQTTWCVHCSQFVFDTFQWPPPHCSFKNSEDNRALHNISPNADAEIGFFRSSHPLELAACSYVDSSNSSAWAWLMASWGHSVVPCGTSTSEIPGKEVSAQAACWQVLPTSVRAAMRSTRETYKCYLYKGTCITPSMWNNFSHESLFWWSISFGSILNSLLKAQSEAAK